MIMANAVIATCPVCQYDRPMQPPFHLKIQRFVYLDQNILSFMAKGQDDAWIELRDKCLRLATAQFWLFPISETHLLELAGSRNVMLARRDHQLAQRLSQGRYFKPYSTIVAMMCERAFRAYLDPTDPAHLNRSEVFERPGQTPCPTLVWTKPVLNLDTTFDKYRMDAQKSQRGIGLYEQLLLSDWPEKFESRDLTFATELQKHQEYLQSSMLRVLKAHLQNEEPTSEGHESETCFKCALAMLDYAEARAIGIERAVDFVLAEAFKSLRWVVTRALIFAHLQETAAAGKKKAKTLQKWAYRQRNDLTDVLYIASCSSFVTDLFVDKRFYDLLQKEEVANCIEAPRIWNAAMKLEFLSEVNDALQSKEFQCQAALVDCVHSSAKFRRLTYEFRDWDGFQAHNRCSL